MTNQQLLIIILSIVVPLAGLVLVQSRALRRDITPGHISGGTVEKCAGVEIAEP